jgi:hypothetical protein
LKSRPRRAKLAQGGEQEKTTRKLAILSAVLIVFAGAATINNAPN